MVAVTMGAKTFLLVLLCPTAWGLMVARCPEGWEAHAGTNKCYYVHSYNRHRTFSDARNYCKAKGGDLAIIDDAGLRDWLVHLISASGNVIPENYLWVGAQNVDGTWQWIQDNTPVDHEMLPWEGTGFGDCAAFTVNSKLIKKDCNWELRFICHRNIEIPLTCDYTNDWTEHIDHCYKTSLRSNSWHDSEVECVIEGGHLVTIESETEQQLAADFADKVRNKLWIGYSEEGHPGSFQWVDGSTSNKTFWQDDQPDESFNGFGAAVVDNAHSSGHWKVEKITTDYHSLCEKEKGSCLPGWQVFESSCYYFNTEAQDSLVWEDAKKTCTDVGAALVVLDTEAEDAFFRTHMPESDTLWLGLYSDPDADTLYWTDGTTMHSKNFTFMTEEDEASAIVNPEQQCVFHQVRIGGDTPSSSWVPTGCHLPRHYACEAPKGKNLTLIPPSNERYCPDGWQKNGQFCYKFDPTEKTWTAAQADCNNLGAELVSLTSWNEQDFVHNNQLTGGWIGLNNRADSEKWVWSDGNEITIENWMYGEPNSDIESCVEMIGSSGEWNDFFCDQKKAFTCKMDASTSPIGTLTTTTAVPDGTACGYGWTENPSTGECYRIEVQDLIFQDARLHCLELHYWGEQSRPDLVSINSAQEQNFVFGLVVAEHLSQASLWIGMNNDYMTTNSWTDGSPSSYFNFNDGEPSSPYSEDCVEMYTKDGKWNDAYCYLRLPFICEKKGTNYVGPQPPPPPQVTCPEGWSFWNNHCYFFSGEQTDWFTAEDRCKSMFGSNLASIISQDENDYIDGELAISWKNAWIGLRDDDNGDKWHWTDGSLYYWTNWGDGEPNNDLGNEHCGEIRANDYYFAGKWNDMPCTNQMYYVCEIDVRTCPQTWTYENGKCYYVSEVEVSRDQGLVQCHEFNSAADLVNIHSEEENKYFSEQLGGITPSCWMGLMYHDDEGKWMWNDGQGLENYENWNTDEPNNLDTEFCGEMISGGDDLGKWNNLACGESRPFGCEIYPTHVVGCEDGWHEFGDYCYWNSNDDYSYESVTFSQALASCRDKGGDLASIHSAEENDFVFSLVYGYGNIFLGLSDEHHQGVMTWSDGTDVTFTHMEGLSGEMYYPSCSAFFSSGYDEWRLISCSAPSTYFCKKPRQAQSIGDTQTGCELGDPYHVVSCYNFPENTNTWDDAKSDCESRGHQLVVLEDKFEAAYISALLGTEGSSAWLGLYGKPMGDGSLIFSWVNGAEVTFENWDRYQPNPELGECVIASGEETNPGLWSTRNCQTPHKYVCEYERVGYTTHPPPTTKPPTYYCLYGWDHLGSSCYKVMHEVSTWGAGEQTCASFGGHLVSIGDVAEHTVVQSLPDLAIVADRYSSVWVGLKEGTETGYEWTDGTPFNYVDWAPGQPDDHHGQERCVSANVHSLQLSDTVCEAHLPFICEAAVGTMMTTLEPLPPPSHMKCSDDPSWYLYGDHCYKFISVVDETAQSWEQSRHLCRMDGGELASILTFEENYWVESMIAVLSDSNMWIGGRALMGVGFEWIDGEPFSYNNWAKGEPNNVNDQEDCVSIYNTNEGYWNDQNCGHTEGRICKRPHGQTKPPPRTTTPPPGHCPPGWVHAGTNCLYFLNKPNNFTTSRKVCQTMDTTGNGIDMISVHSAAEQAYLMAALGVMQDDNMWLGMTYESGFHWVDQTDVSYLNWGPGEPNGANNGEGCVEVSSKTGLWNDISCSLKYKGICMMVQDPGNDNHQELPKCPAPFNTYTAYDGACYKTVSTAKSWQEAEDTCVAEGAHLVSILSHVEDSFVWAAGLESSFSNMWVGLNNIKDHHMFRWSDGWPAVYTNWASSVSGENCVSVSMTDGRWSTQQCDSAKPFTCKYSNGTAPTPDPPTTGHCFDSRWLDFGGDYCYLVSNVSMTWSYASFQCTTEKYDSSLVSIHSWEEMNYVTMAMNGFNEPFWIGLRDTENGQWWSDGSGLNYFNWQDDEPNSSDEQCTEALAWTGVWNDVSCEAKRYFMCKSPKEKDSGGSTPATPFPPTNSPGTPGGLDAGGIAGIVIGVLFVVAAVAFVGVAYMKKRPKKTTYPNHSQHHEFENVAYNIDNAKAGASRDTEGVDLKGVLDGSDV